MTKKVRGWIACSLALLSCASFAAGGLAYGLSPRVLQKASECGVTCGYWIDRSVQLLPWGTVAFIMGLTFALVAGIVALTTIDA